MTTSLRYQIMGRRGDFSAWGLGFHYGYLAAQSTLKVSLSDDQKDVLLHTQLDKTLRMQSKQFVHYFDKVAQIKALMLSNHSTATLSETMEIDRLRGVLDSTYGLAASACSLKARKLKPYAEQAMELYNLKHFHIRYLCCHSGEGYFRAHIKTLSGNEIIARAMTLHGVLMTLSEKIMRDLIALEFSSQHNMAHNLLTLASQLAMISRALNDGFRPASRIVPPAALLPREHPGYLSS